MTGSERRSLLPPLAVGGSARSEIVERLADAFDGYAGMMRCSLGHQGWGLDFACENGPGAHLGLGQRFEKYLEAAPIGWTLWDPSNVAPHDRNRAKLVDNTLFRNVHIVRHFYAPAGIDRLSHLMLIASRGPRLLGWIGLWRERPFNATDRARLDASVGELGERLALADELGAPSITWNVIDAALEALERPAFVLSQTGRIELANRAGLGLLRREGRGVAAQLFHAMREGHPAWRVTPIHDAGSPRLALIVLCPTAFEDDFAERLVRAGSKWQLTKTQRAVLGMLARGLSNKEIASSCRRSERTVELHVSAILQRAGVESRSRLLVSFWARSGKR